MPHDGEAQTTGKGRGERAAQWTQLLVTGVTVGSICLLIALGYVSINRTSRTRWYSARWSRSPWCRSSWPIMASSMFFENFSLMRWGALEAVKGSV